MRPHGDSVADAMAILGVQHFQQCSDRKDARPLCSLRQAAAIRWTDTVVLARFPIHQSFILRKGTETCLAMRPNAHPRLTCPVLQ